MKNKQTPPVPKILKPANAVAEEILAVSKTNSESSNINIDHSNTAAVSNSIYNKIASNEEIIGLFPDVELSIQILVSSILAPNDLLHSKLNYDVPELGLPSNINSLITDSISAHIKNNYKLEEKLSNILREALFTKGAYAEMIVPDTDILKMYKEYTSMGVSTESWVDSMDTISVLGDTSSTSLSVESMDNHGSVKEETTTIDCETLGVSFTEDLQVLRAVGVHEAKLATEGNPISFKRMGLSALMSKKNMTGGVSTISTDNRDGSPMIIKLPVGSVLPIHMSSDPTTHSGYLVMLDDNGIPITNTSILNEVKGIDELVGKSVDIKSTIITKAATALNAKLGKDVKVSGMDELYTKALMATIQTKVQTGVLGKTVDIPGYSDVYQMIFARAMKGNKTRLLYVPKDNLTYFAFEYRENGTGKSLIEKASMLYSIRAGNLFTRIMANVKNSITTTTISATLDENDPDPQHTSELLMAQAKKTQQVKYPVGLTNTKDYVDWMHNVGYRFNIKHDKLPNIDLNISDDTRSIAVPDTDLDEQLQENIIMSFGLNVETVMAGKEAQLATTVVANDVLFAKRIMDYQLKLNPQLSGYVRRVLKNDGVLKRKIYDILEANVTRLKSVINKSLTKEERVEYEEYLSNTENLTDYAYIEYANNISVTLPGVEVLSNDGTLDGLNAFVDMLDTFVPLIISSDTLPADLVGDLSDKMEDITSAIKTVLIKNWIDDRNFLPEITKFLTLDSDGKPRYDILEEYSDFTKTLSKAVIPYLKKTKKSSNRDNAKLEKIEADDGTEDLIETDNVDSAKSDDGITEDTPVEGGDAPAEDGTDLTEI